MSALQKKGTIRMLGAYDSTVKSGANMRQSFKSRPIPEAAAQHMTEEDRNKHEVRRLEEIAAQAMTDPDAAMADLEEL